MTDSDLKVNDKRMFTADGELREEFQHLDEPSEAPAEEASAPQEPPPPVVEEAPAEPEAPVAADSAEDLPPSSRPAGGPGPGFQDLVGLLAEYAAVYLGDATAGDGRSMLDLRAAQAHIDLLDVLREKTRGNLNEAEDRFLEEVLYQLRLVYVEKSRQEG